MLNTYLMTEHKRTTGRNTTCKIDGAEVKCWGVGTDGRLGTGSSESTCWPDAPVVGLPDPVDSLNLPVDVDVGPDSACSRLRGGQVWCWGRKANGYANSNEDLTAMQLADLGNSVADLAMGQRFSCALKMDGTVWCWGLGEAAGPDWPGIGPIQVGASELGNESIQVVAGYDHACALKLDGTVWCWGNNDAKQLANHGPSMRTPVRVGATQLGNHTVRLTAKVDHTCALMDDGGVWCWGRNGEGQLGTWSSEPLTLVHALEAGNDNVEVATGSMSTYVLKQDGTVWCWGWNGLGQCGTGNQESNDYLPVQVILPRPAVSIQATMDALYAVLDDETIWATGGNGFSQLTEDGDWMDIYTPIMVYDPANGGSTVGGGDGGTCAPGGGGGGTTLGNPTFDVDLEGWEASASGSATHATRDCRTGSGCAMLSGDRGASLNSTTWASGFLAYTASAWVAGAKRVSVTGRLRIVERDPAGNVVAESTSDYWVSTQGEYKKPTVYHVLQSDLNRVFIEIISVDGYGMLIDDVEVSAN